MALVTIPGSDTSDSYATLAAADAHHSAMGHAGWTGTDAAKEAALRRATLWIDGTYRSRFPGIRRYAREQALEWPRANATDRDGWPIDADTIPAEIATSTIEAALRELGVPGSLSPDYVAALAVKREKVGPIEVEYLGAAGAGAAQPILTLVDGILSGLFSGASGGVLLVRA
jgi:hypothetical protein